MFLSLFFLKLSIFFCSGALPKTGDGAPVCANYYGAGTNGSVIESFSKSSG
jgi:hypothetical protein